MTYSITFTVAGVTRHCISYGRTSTAAQWRAIRQVCKSFHCSKADVVIEKCKRRS